MKKRSLLFTGLACAAAVLAFTMTPSAGRAPVVYDGEQEERAAPEVERAFFEAMHHPYGAAIPGAVLRRMWEQIDRLPEDRPDRTTETPTGWQCIGPYGSPALYLPSATAVGRYTGRVLDVEVVNGVGLRFAAASGGLWSTILLVQVPISDELPSLAVSTVATRPGDPNTMILGTGEALQGRTGTGLWRTMNGGAAWTRLTLSPEPDFVQQVRYDPGVPGLVHAVTSEGYYRSSDDGTTWIRFLSGYFHDIAFASSGSSRFVYVSRWSGGVYRSTNDGQAWSKVGGGLPQSGNGRTDLTAAPGVGGSPSVVYAAMQRDDMDGMLGIYRSADGGFTWTTITNGIASTTSYNGYAGGIAACPTNPDIVVLGWAKSYRTVNGGQSWQLIDNLHPDNHDNTHDDWHGFTWTNGGIVYGASDGGVFFSTDFGATWRPTTNNSPITQFYSVAVGGWGNSVIAGGAQDNGVIRTTDGGATWGGVLCCDGAGVALAPPNGFGFSWFYAMYGSAPGSGNRMSSINYGLNWGSYDYGLPPGNVIRTDDQGVVYTAAGNTVYRSTNAGAWLPLNPSAFSSPVANITVGRSGGAGGPAVYACLSSSTGPRLQVWDNGAWHVRGLSFPEYKTVRKVVPHPADPNVAFAVINGLTNWGDEKIWRTTNRGADWADVTGTLPNVPVSDLVPHPTNPNIFFVGTEMGCYKTETGGQYWSKWNLGMPKATIITEMTYIDESASGGGFFVLAATYGRSMWKREVSTDDPLSTPWLLRDPGLYIPDFTAIQDTMHVPPQNSGTVVRARVRLDSLLHDRTRDLTLVLLHAGVRDTILYRPGGEAGRNLLSTTLLDDAPLAVDEGESPYTGEFRPYRPLNQFWNLPADGDWILEVYDDGFGAMGTLVRWSLLVEYRTAGLNLTTSAVPIAGGWNLVSAPHTMGDYSRAGLFPTAVSEAFGYQSGYSAAPSLVNGKGYWLKFSGPENLEMTGGFRNFEAIPVLPGWNLIGSISGPVPVANLASDPPGLVTSSLFGYGALGYVVADTIRPGLGYWVKVNGSGMLVLSSSPTASASRLRIRPTAELPPPPPGEESATAAELPADFALEQNYPNPFNPATTITFAIPNQGDGVGTRHAVSLQVFDLLGRHVATLVDDSRAPGVYSVAWDASNLSTGTYIYRLTAGGFTATRRMMLVK